MKINKLFLQLKNGIYFFLKEYRGELAFQEEVKFLITFPIYIFICLPVIVYAFYLSFIKEKFPIIGKSVGTIRYVTMEDNPLLFYSIWGGGIFIFIILTAILTIKSFKAFRRLLERQTQLESHTENAGRND